MRAQPRRCPERTAEPTQSRRDFPLVKSRLLACSTSNVYEEARREWRLGDIYEEGSDSFIDRCELCNQPNLRRCYEVLNPETDGRFLVGSTCIRRFLILRGTDSSEETGRLLDQRTKQLGAVRRLQEVLPAILTEPAPNQLHSFREASRAILGNLEHKSVTAQPYLWARYLSALLGSNRPQWQVDRVRAALFAPHTILTKAVRLRATDDSIGQWASTTKSKRTRAQVTISPSTGDRPDTALR